MQNTAIPGNASPHSSLQGLVAINIVLAGLLVVTLAGVAVIWATSRDDNASANANTVKNLKPIALASTTSDRTPMTVNELFPDTTLESRGRRYEILDTDQPQTCAGAVEGNALTSALASHDCRRVIRALAQAPNTKNAPGLLVTLGLADVRDSQAAQNVDDLLNDPQRNHFNMMYTKEFPDNNRGVKVQHRSWGHYVLFFAVSAPDKQAVAVDDPALLQLLDDCTHYLLSSLATHALTGGV